MRLFIAVDLPVEIKQALLKLQSDLKQLGINGFWKSPDNFHITLEFLGEIDPNKVAALTETMSIVVRHYKPFNLSITGIGAFPSLKKPHTLWTAVSGSLKELERLKQDLHHELKSNGFKLDERKFKPHISLASRPILDKIDLSAVRSKMLGEYMVTEIVLFESKVIRGKRVYLDLFRAGFGKL